MHSAARKLVCLNQSEMNPQGGCLAKLPALQLHELLTGAWQTAFGTDALRHPMDEPEDCAVLSLGDQQLLVTTDVGPLVGRDLRRAGRIAALHAMADVFACGGMPRWALPILVVNRGQPLDYMEAVLAGMLEACAAEQVQVVGGHTVTGREAMAGLTVLGMPRVSKVLRKCGAQLGDQLLLSKPLGVGLVARAYQLGVVGDAEMESALHVMETSNGPAAELALQARVHAATDVTGFGLLGHLGEMLSSGLGAVLDMDAVPVLAAAQPLLDDRYRTVWTDGNLEYVHSRWPLVGLTEPARLLALLDPQTNGGLLVAADLDMANRLAGPNFHVVGHITSSPVIEVQASD